MSDPAGLDRKFDTTWGEAESLYDLICANFYSGMLTPAQAKAYGIKAIQKDYMRLLQKHGTARASPNPTETA